MEHVPNQEGLRALGEAIEHRQSARGKRYKKHKVRWRRVFLLLAVFVLALVGAGAGYLWHLSKEVHHINVGGLSSAQNAGVEANTENILLVGSTSRCALQHQTVAYGLCTQGVTGVNSDVVMILHLNPATKTVSLLSIPRDLFIPNARTSGANKIDAALADGPSQLVRAIGDDFGIPIQHYIELNFDTFAGVVNALGGITMYFPMPVFDAYSGLYVTTPGCHHLDGYHALQVVRARHLQYKTSKVTSSTPHHWPQEGLSDLARIRRDHEFLRVLASSLSKRGLSSPTTDLSLVNAVAPNLTVDKGLSLHDLVNIALTYHRVNVTSAPQLTMPVAATLFSGYTYKGATYGDIEFPVQPLDRQVVNQFLGISTQSSTMDGSPLPSPKKITVSVLNGSGVSGQAGTTASALSSLGFKVVGTGDATPVSTHSETFITYNQFSPSSVSKAEEVARVFEGGVILQKGTTSLGANVTVTTGTNFSLNLDALVVPKKAHKKKSKAKSTTSSSTLAPATTTTTTAPAIKLTSSFTVPNQSSTTLAAWDPRACPLPSTTTTTGAK